ncbi:MAG: GrpB family protein [Pirellulaceae bacterium]
MSVVVRQYDPSWGEEFCAASAMVLDALGTNATVAHHIGSTAIPNIVAKPIIDMLIVVQDINSVDARNQAMEDLGYEVKGEYGILKRRYFRKDSRNGTRIQHVHVYACDSAQIERHLAFRDFMIAHPNWAARYSKLKLELADRHPHSMADYIAGKDAFIKQIDELAKVWRREVITKLSAV